MTANISYNIDPFYSDKLLDLKASILNIFSYLKKNTGLNNDITSKLNDDIGGVLTKTEDAVKIASDVDTTEAKKIYTPMEKSLGHFIKTYHSLEKVKFFENEALEFTCSKILRNLYKAESKLRHKAFDDVKEGKNEDERLNEVATLISVNSVLH